MILLIFGLHAIHCDLAHRVTLTVYGCDDTVPTG